MPQIAGAEPENRIEYFSSQLGEQGPTESQRLEVNCLLGQRIFGVVAHQKTIRQFGDDKAFRGFIEVSVPLWLQEDAAQFALLGGFAEQFTFQTSGKKP